MKKNILLIVGILLIIGTLGNFKYLNDWSTAEMIGFNTWSLVAIFGGIYLIYLGIKNPNKKEKKIEKIPWHQNFNWQIILILSFIFINLYFLTNIALFNYIFFIGLVFSVIVLIKKIRMSKKITKNILLYILIFVIFSSVSILFYWVLYNFSEKNNTKLSMNSTIDQEFFNDNDHEKTMTPEEFCGDNGCKIVNEDNSNVELKNKISCFNLKETVKDEINRYNDQQIPQEGVEDRGVKQTFLCFNKKEFKELFFNNNLNSCLYVEKYQHICKSIDPWVSDNYYVRNENYKIIDILNNKQIDETRTIYRAEIFNTMNDVDRMIEKYK